MWQIQKHWMYHSMIVKAACLHLQAWEMCPKLNHQFIEYFEFLLKANHTYAFTKAAISQKAQPSTLNSAKCMAMTVIDLICNPKLLKDVKENFKKK